MRAKRIAILVVFLSFVILISTCSFSQESPVSPKDLAAEAKDSSVTLSWTPSMDTSVIGFNIYRREDVAGGKFEKINKNMISSPSYQDKAVKSGKSYVYICKTINSDGLESEGSNIVGAPKMKMDTNAIVTHMGRPVRIAVPGDVIKYNVDFANKGFGVAENVVIIYAVPRGTTFMQGTAKCEKYKVKISYFDKGSNKWVDSVDDEENVSKIRFAVTDNIEPVSKGNNGTASLKVLVSY